MTYDRVAANYDATSHWSRKRRGWESLRTCTGLCGGGCWGKGRGELGKGAGRAGWTAAFGDSKDAVA